MTNESPSKSRKKTATLVIVASLASLSVFVVLLIVGIVTYAMLMSPSFSNKTTEPVSVVEAVAEGGIREFRIDASIEAGWITFLIDRVVLTRAYRAFFREYKASDKSAFLLVYFTVRNNGHSPRGVRTEPFFIMTENAQYDSDFDMTRDAFTAEGLDSDLEVQPGLEKRAINVFEIPLQQLDNNPTLHVLTTGGWTGSVPLFPQSKKAAQDKPTSDTSKPDEARGTSTAANLSATQGVRGEDGQRSADSLGDVLPDERSASNPAPSPASETSTTVDVSDRGSMLEHHFANLAEGSDQSLQRAYADFAPAWQAKQIFEEFAKGSRAIAWTRNNGGGAIVREVLIDSEHAQVDVDMGHFTDDRRTIRFSLVKLGGQWKIAKGTPL